MTTPGRRKDRVGEFRTALDKNKKIIFMTQEVCGICGQPVDKTLTYPDPMSKTVDHIIPIAKGGHPSDLSNLQLAHRCCNRQKSDKLFLTPTLKNNPGGQIDQGLINRGGQSNQIGNAAQGSETECGDETGPGSKKRAAMNNSQGYPETSAGTGKIDNNNLPQHADWASLQW